MNNYCQCYNYQANCFSGCCIYCNLPKENKDKYLENLNTQYEQIFYIEWKKES